MQFLNPWLLLGLAAIIIPIAVHLFNFRKYRKVYFSNVKFLKELKQQTRKQSNLLHRLVLLCRILAFIFIVLAFAQPFFAGKSEPTIKNSNIISVFVDNSFSMEAQGTRGTLFDEAKDKAAELAGAYSQDDQFQLLTNDFEGRHQRLVSREEFLTMLNDLDVSSSVRSLNEIIARQNDLLSQNKKANAIVHYISDFQRSTVMKSVPDSGLSAGYIIPLKPASTNNLYIDSCWFGNPVLQLNQHATLFVKISNVSDNRLEKIPVRLLIDNAQRAVASVDVDPGGSQEISFTFTNNKAGYIGGSIEINDFPVTYDDIYYFSYRIAPEIRVLCINEREPDPYINSVYKIDSIVQLTNTTVRQIDFSSLSSFRLIILNGIETFSTGLIQEIVKFAENGGNVLYIPSLEVPAETQNMLLSGLGGDLLKGIDASQVKVGRINTNHPVYSEVFEQGTLKAENIDFPSVNNRFIVSQSGSTSSEILLELANGEPLLSVNPVGRGRSYLFSTSLDDRSGNFVRHALFVPTMLNIAFLSEQLSPLMYFTDYQKPVSITNEYKHSDNVLKLAAIDGSYEFIPEFRQINGQNYIFINDQILTAGLYKVKLSSDDIQLLAFNYNRNESNLSTATDEELENLQKKTGYTLIENTPKSLEKVLNENPGHKNLWKWFVVAALLSLLAEVMLLVFFKRRYTTV
ncbi:MAG TPA: BatA domain-containing protein [Lentimicrobium sp.]|nr:BatA domain-containing protein [Lentimicrobium sp.]